MSVKMRLSRGGSKKRPYYYVVIAHGTSPRDGRIGLMLALRRAAIGDTVNAFVEPAGPFGQAAELSFAGVARGPLQEPQIARYGPGKGLLASGPKTDGAAGDAQQLGQLGLFEAQAMKRVFEIGLGHESRIFL